MKGNLGTFSFMQFRKELAQLTVEELGHLEKMIDTIKKEKVKSSLTVGQKVYVVQKTKKTPGTVRKVNKTRAIVTMINGLDYNVPFTMLEAA